MGQRSTRQRATTPEFLEVCVFPSPLGYWAILGHGDVVFALTLGHPEAAAAHAAFACPFDEHTVSKSATDWYPSLRQRLQRYAAGESIEFHDVQLHLPRLTPFQQQIIKLTRKVPHGATVTYGELATRAGHPRAARAVGTVMSCNRIPILIPCHRVLAAGGKIGGFSAPQGINLKVRLLELEQK